MIVHHRKEGHNKGTEYTMAMSKEEYGTLLVALRTATAVGLHYGDLTAAFKIADVHDKLIEPKEV